MMRRYLRTFFYLIWVSLALYSFAPSSFAQETTDLEIAAVKGEVDELQRTQARQHIPELLIFLALVITFAILLRLKARDLERLRNKTFFKSD